MVFHWSRYDSNSPQVRKTILNILANLNDAMIGRIVIFPLISDSSGLLSKPLETVPSAPITNTITVTFSFQSFLSSQARSKYLSIFSLSFIFTLWSAGTISFFFFFFVRCDLVWSSGRDWVICFILMLCVSFSWTDTGLCIYHFLVWSNFSFSHNSL